MDGTPNANVSDRENMSICLSEGNSSPADQTRDDFVTLRPQRIDNNMQSQFQEFKEEIRKLLTCFSATNREDINEIKGTLQAIQLSNQNIETSIAFLNSQQEDFNQRLTLLENHVKEDNEYILFLENKLDVLQTDSRKTNFELKNVPKKENESKEDLINLITCLSETIDCKITRSDIKDIYRVRGKNLERKNTPIIIETNSVLLKTDFIKKTKLFNTKNSTKLCAKHLGLKIQEDTPVFLSEHLTAKAARLHFLARDLTKSKKYKFCWTAYGKVYVQKSEQSKIIQIKSEEQVQQLLSENLQNN